MQFRLNGLRAALAAVVGVAFFAAACAGTREEDTDKGGPDDDEHAAGGSGGEGSNQEAAGGTSGEAADAAPANQPSPADGSKPSISDATAPLLKDAQGNDAGTHEPSPAGPRVPAIVAVGYGGLRVLSRDGGKTWMNRQALAPTGGDDRDLLRGVAWGDGMFVAVGWKLMTSEDGIKWVERTKPGLHDCVAYANGTFYIKNLRGGDTMKSRDRGLTWTDHQGDVSCSTNFEGYASGGVRLRSVWQGAIERAQGSGAFSRVYQDPQDNHVNAFNAGFVSP